MNKNGKLFGKISIIDIIVVVCIVVLAFGLYAKFTSSSDAVTSSEKSNIEFVYKVKSVRDYTVDGFKKGGPLYDSDTKEYMGEVTDVRTEPAVMQVSLVDGAYKELEIPNKYDVYVTVQVSGKYNSLGFYTNDNKYIGAGQTLNAWSKYTTTGGEIVDVREAQ
ncbi:MAG: DUF4330 domain-containing protein [Clostridiales bacterium]|nr:DUF4330 domain-containing protein [Clostridiales bacterium]